jgi:hypothetical protein
MHDSNNTHSIHFWVPVILDALHKGTKPNLLAFLKEKLPSGIIDRAEFAFAVEQENLAEICRIIKQDVLNINFPLVCKAKGEDCPRMESVFLHGHLSVVTGRTIGTVTVKNEERQELYAHVGWRVTFSRKKSSALRETVSRRNVRVSAILHDRNDKKLFLAPDFGYYTDSEVGGRRRNREGPAHCVFYKNNGKSTNISEAKQKRSS